MSKSLFSTVTPALPSQLLTTLNGGAAVLPSGALVAPTPAVTSMPVPGPNAFEVGVLAYDPDSATLVVRVRTEKDAEEIEAVIDLQAMTANGTIEIILGEGKLAPKIVINVKPRVKPPAFSTPEEADAWLEEHA